MPRQNFEEQKNWGWGGDGNYGVQMNGMMQVNGVQQQNNNAWWTMQNSDEYQVYLKWCEERRLAIAEQEQQQALLREIQHRAEEQERVHEHERAAKEMQMKREAMVAQWNMWKSQLNQADGLDAVTMSLSDMKYD